MNLGDTAYAQSKHDHIIKETLKNISEKEAKIVDEYKTIKEVSCMGTPEHLKAPLEKLLEERKLFLEYKLTPQKDQIDALYKLLEYVNYLEVKDQTNIKYKKQRDIADILRQIHTVEGRMSPITSVLYG